MAKEDKEWVEFVLMRDEEEDGKGKRDEELVKDHVRPRTAMRGKKWTYEETL